MGHKAEGGEERRGEVEMGRNGMGILHNRLGWHRGGIKGWDGAVKKGKEGWKGTGILEQQQQ